MSVSFRHSGQFCIFCIFCSFYCDLSHQRAVSISVPRLIKWLELRQYKNRLASVKNMLILKLPRFSPYHVWCRWGKSALISKVTCSSLKRVSSYIVLAVECRWNFCIFVLLSTSAGKKGTFENIVVIIEAPMVWRTFAKLGQPLLPTIS